ncbi:MAG: hypothetical protein UY62_C0039G0013 [Parcubacteria group bacterium GW2011_GWF2_50_9]|nr:MAG: hypothetical protein UY62_C0039G0013 [Parcubacteria group bacterium GW2011_GWF2_50_9]
MRKNTVMKRNRKKKQLPRLTPAQKRALPPGNRLGYDLITSGILQSYMEARRRVALESTP